MSVATPTSNPVSATRFPWGAAPSQRYEQLAQRWRPLFATIREGAVERDYYHRLPSDEIRLLRDSGFLSLRLPERLGGSGATLPELVALLIELGAADTNVVNAIRSHFGFIEDVLTAAPSEWRDRWLERLGEGVMIGAGYSEGANRAKAGTFVTELERTEQGLVLNGEKFYTTGSLFADWMTVGAQDGDDTRAVQVPTRQPGVEIIDDWDGFGQALTASGTARFTDVAIDPGWVRPDTARFPYAVPFFQTVHLASLAGIGRALAEDLAQQVAKRDRIYTNGNASRVSEDPQILQVVGQVHGAAYAARASVLQSAAAIQHSYEAALSETLSPEQIEQAHAQAHLEVDCSVSVVTKLILDASTVLFDALGASATLRPKGLDRYWRNARTITSHNPRIYRERQLGNFAVNGTPPPNFYRVGKGDA
ncbi:acyl-CoA dehydrogenase family protein [Carnimonas bestiolae]|uniref:acyl-CoA dehydrogenase family protein n=1 Tax=Carnimonas bestiolae TaxID=3402172 RepID=UPI003EDBDF7F